jgi:hypothetical protein
MTANRRMHHLRTRVNKRESGGILLPMYQSSGIFNKPTFKGWSFNESNEFKNKLGLNYEFRPNLNGKFSL